MHTLRGHDKNGHPIPLSNPQPFTTHSGVHGEDGRHHASTEHGVKAAGLDCGIEFASSTNLEVHSRIHLEALSSDPPYICYLCNKQFAQKHCLLRHHCYTMQLLKRVSCRTRVFIASNLLLVFVTDGLQIGTTRHVTSYRVRATFRNLFASRNWFWEMVKIQKFFEDR